MLAGLWSPAARLARKHLPGLAAVLTCWWSSQNMMVTANCHLMSLTSCLLMHLALSVENLTETERERSVNYK